LHNFIQYNFVTIITIIFILIFLRRNDSLKPSVQKRIKLSVAFLTVLVIVDHLEFLAMSFTYPTQFRAWALAVSYAIRPLVIYEIVLIVYPGKEKYRKYLIVPAVINIGVMLLAPFTDLVFTFDASNEFVKGPLEISTHIASISYLTMAMAFSKKYFKEKDFTGVAILYGIIIVCFTATILEMNYDYVGLLTSSMAVSLTFYYMYLYSQFSSKDVLTGALNRQCFYADLVRQKNKLSALIILDLNNLKQINDKQGHVEGDKAICAVAECISDNLFAECRLYRIGGDEFAILCQKRTIEELKEMLKIILQKMEQGPYRCAFGLAAYTPEKTLDDIYREADQLMYQHKEQMKKK